MKIAVIDGLGGGLGCQIIKRLKSEINNSNIIIALGTNSQATSRMIQEGADKGATGANSIRVVSKQMDVIIAPLGVIIPNSMLGEVTADIAESVADSSARKYLLGIKQPHVKLVGLKEKPINELLDELVNEIKDNI